MTKHQSPSFSLWNLRSKGKSTRLWTIEKSKRQEKYHKSQFDNQDDCVMHYNHVKVMKMKLVRYANCNFICCCLALAQVLTSFLTMFLKLIKLVSIKEVISRTSNYSRKNDRLHFCLRNYSYNFLQQSRAKSF